MSHRITSRTLYELSKRSCIGCVLTGGEGDYEQQDGEGRSYGGAEDVSAIPSGAGAQERRSAGARTQSSHHHILTMLTSRPTRLVAPAVRYFTRNLTYTSEVCCTGGGRNKGAERVTLH